MGDSDEAPPRQYKLKQKEFERVNDPTPAEPPAPAPGLDERARAGDPNDVFALRQQLRAREQNRGMDALTPVAPRKSRRKRDYWLVMTLGNGLFIALPILSRGNIAVMVFCLAGAIILSASATWVMWFILDDY